jgi:hypothetical protein
MFKLAKSSDMKEVVFNNFKEHEMTVDAVASIMACIDIH